MIINNIFKILLINLSPNQSNISFGDNWIVDFNNFLKCLNLFNYESKFKI